MDQFYKKSKINNMINNFLKNEFIIEKIFDEKEIQEFENTFLKLCKMQIRKLNLKIKSSKIQNVANFLGKKNFSALNEACLMANNSSVGHKLASNKKLLEISNKLLKSNNSSNIISGPNIFINFSNSKISKYTWHSEQIWYPKRRNFVNIWCPIFEDRTKKNSIAIKLNSHKQNWFNFSEYQGYDGKYNKDSLVQYEIPENFVKKYRTIIPKVKKNEGLFFDRKIVHRSLNIKNKKVLFAITFRVHDYTNDMTLSANWADIPYNRKSFGIPDINVN